MIELLKTNNMVTISFVEALLREQNIEYMVLDANMSILEGSIGAIPRRILVEDGAEARARRLLKDAELEKELVIPTGRSA